MFFKEFAKALLFSKFTQPVNYSFKNTNRAKFNTYLGNLHGVGQLDNQMIGHYKEMNTYCDTQNVDLTDQELSFFQNNLVPGTSVAVSDLIAKENAMFKSGAAQYPEDTLDFILRDERPDFITQFLPGKLNIAK